LAIMIYLRELIKKKKNESMDFVQTFCLPPPSPLKFGSKNRYQSPETVPQILIVILPK
jgi:hypothetical protein